MALPLKSGADLYNQQAIRMRLHNLGADPAEVGKGLIYFNTNTDTNGSNHALHACVHDGTSFRALAYVDDVANNEDFRALQSKVNTIDTMLNVDSAEGVVSTWQEIQAFLDQIGEGKDLMDMLNGKLNTSGGTIEGLLTIDRYNALIQYKKNGTALGYMGIDSELVPIVYSANGLTSEKILHSGNVGEYALKTDGSNEMKGRIKMGSNAIQWNVNGKSYILSPETMWTSGVYDLAWYNGSAWKQIAFTDSTVSGARKLRTDNDTIYATFNDTAKVISFAGDSGLADYITFIGGKTITLRYGASATNGFLLNSSGNVGIGTNDPTEKLHVVGNLHVTGNIIADGEVSAGGAGEEGGGSSSGGGGAFHSEGIAVGATQTTIAHGLGTDDIVVSIYEKDGVSGRWSIILTDVEIVDANNIIVSFGSATTVEHKVVIMGAVA